MSVAAIRDVELAYDVTGPSDGVPFVWGHGLTSSRADEDVFPLIDTATIAASQPVIRYDALGHGESTLLPTPERGSWAELAHDQIALLDHLGVDDVFLGGASMGTGTALHAAVFLADRVKAMVLAIPPTGWEGRSAQVGMYEQMASIVSDRGVEPLIAAAAAAAPPDPFSDSPEHHQRTASRLRNADQARLVANFRGAAYAQLPAPDMIRQLTVPTLVLAWTGDPAHPISTADRLGQLLPDCTVVQSATLNDFETWTARTVAFLRDR